MTTSKHLMTNVSSRTGLDTNRRHWGASTVTDDQPSTATSPIDDTLLRILVCPVDRAALRVDESFLVCTLCDRRYPVEDGIPNMLIDLP